MQQEQLPKPKSTAIPKYADKYKNMLEQSSKHLPLPLPETSLAQNHAKTYFFYKVKTIGVGAHSFVHLVQDEQSKMLCAEKSIAIQHAFQVKGDLISEIRILSFTSHQNLIKLYYFYRSETHVNIVMEYAEDSLFGLKQKFKVFKQKEILELIRQLLNGLCYLHGLGIVHADVKLENIMIANGVVKLVDFGYAHRHKIDRDPLEHSEVVGTMEYLPPQYALGTDSGFKRDVWAVGILAYEMLVGKNPFEDLKENEKWSKLVKSPPDVYLGELMEREKELGINSQKVEQLVEHIFCSHQKRWSAEELLKLGALQPVER